MMPEKRRKVGSGKSARSEKYPASRQRTEPKAEISRSVSAVRNTARFLLLGLIAAAPYYYGCATWDGQLICTLASLVVLLLAIIFAPREGRGTLIHRTLSFLLLFGLIQTIPLPDALWSWVSPNAKIEREIDALASEFSFSETGKNLLGLPPTIERLDAPSTISIAPKQSRATLAVFASGLAILWASLLLMKDKKWRLRMLIALAASGVGIALLGILQALNLLPPTSDPNTPSFGPFVNRNSAPQFLSIGVGCTFALFAHWFDNKENSTSEKYGIVYPAQNIVARVRRLLEAVVSKLDGTSVVSIFSLVLLLTAVLATSSRGGILACSLALIVLIVRLLGEFGSFKVGFIMLVCGIVATLALNAIGLQTTTSKRLSTLNEELHQLSNVRFDLWSDILSRSEFWLFGSGHGTFHLAVLSCDFPFAAGWFMHAENLYIETFVTHGLVGGVALAGFAIFCFYSLQQTLNKRLIHIAVLFPLCAIATQSMVDFSVILPGLFLPFAALIGPLEHESDRLPKWYFMLAWEKWTSLAIILVVVGLGLSPMIDFVQAERLARNQNLRITGDTSFEVARQEQLRFGTYVYESTHWPSELDNSERLTLSRPELSVAFMRHQRQTVPSLSHLADQSEAALTYLRDTAEPMSQTVAGSPLDWRASWGLLRADLNVLSKQERARNYARLLLAASHKPELLCDIGSHLIWSGEKEAGMRFWQKAIPKSPILAQKAIQLVPDAISSKELKTLLPSSPFVQISAAASLRRRGATKSADELLSLIELQFAIEQSSSAQQWQASARLAEYQKRFEAAADCMVKAATMDATNSDLRHQAAVALLRVGRLPEASAEIDRALRRFPTNARYLETQQSILNALGEEAK